MHDILRKANDSASYANIDIPFVFPGLPPWLFGIVFFAQYPLPPGAKFVLRMIHLDVW